MLAIEIAANGGPEALEPVERPTPEPAPGQVLIAQRAIGVNFVDTQHRAGAPFPSLPLPLVPGIEAAGVVAAVGAAVAGVAVGDRVAYAGPMPGAYAEYAAIDADLVVPVPDAHGFEAAVTVLMQGLTAHYLTHDAHAVADGEWVLVHAAGSGVGRLVAAYSRARGGRVIGATRGQHRLAEILAAGAEAAVDITDADFPRAVEDVSGRCHVVYDSVGGPYFEPNLRCLRARGDLVMYGLAAGPLPAFDPGRLSGFYDTDLRGSLRITWTTLGDHVPTPAALRVRAAAVFADAASGVLVPPPVTTFPLAAAADAHRALESGLEGKLLLLP